MKNSILNVYAKSSASPWLFDDLKAHFEKLNLVGVHITATESPDVNANVWIAMRTSEASLSPDLERTVACIHDLYHHDGMYDPGGDRAIVKKVKGLVLSHPYQRDILSRSGISISNKECLERPLGALSAFSPGDEMPKKFTIAWVGKNYWRKRIDWFIEALEGLELAKDQFQIMLLGMDVEAPAQQLRSLGFDCVYYSKSEYPIETYPDLYRKMSCLVITGITEAGPLTLFESLASGNPVIATKVGWAPFLETEDDDAITLVDNPKEISKALLYLYQNQEVLFRKRHSTNNLVSNWTLDGWVEQVALLATSLITKEKTTTLE